MSSVKNNFIKINDLKPGQQAHENFFISQDYILLEKGMNIEPSDVALLKKWKIEKIYTKKYLQSEKKFSLYFREQIKGFRDFTRTFLSDVKEFYDMTRLNYKISIPKYDDHFVKLINFYENPANFFLFYVNTEIGSSTYEEVALLTAFYAIMIGHRMNLNEEELKKLFYAAIFADIGFQRKSEKTALERNPKKSLTQSAFQVDNHHYLDFHIKLSCDILKKELNAPSDLVYLVLTQHVYLDGTGYPSISSEKVNKLARVFSLAHNFVYLVSDFLKPFRESPLPSNAVLIMLKHKERYDEQALKCLLSTNSFFPPGEVLLLSNQKAAVSIKATYRDPKRPIVEVIIQPKKLGISKTETINLAEENLDIVALIGKQTTRKKLIRNIYGKL